MGRQMAGEERNKTSAQERKKTSARLSKDVWLALKLAAAKQNKDAEKIIEDALRHELRDYLNGEAA